MEAKINSTNTRPLRIGIIGAGFAGTAFAAALQQLSAEPTEIVLFEKSPLLAAGDAYSTPYPFHLLNVRARDMSALEQHPDHFVQWLRTSSRAKTYLDPCLSIEEQYLPRVLYADYLKSLLENMGAQTGGNVKLTVVVAEVVDILSTDARLTVCLDDKRTMQFDKIVLAIGQNPSSHFPFPVSDEVQCIQHTWDYQAPKQIASDDAVLIMGTGLSMVDTVLTLHHQQHQGPIYAVSRHGLLSLPHANTHLWYKLIPEQIPSTLRELTKWVRKQAQLHMAAGGDWRSIMGVLRVHIPRLWRQLTLPEKKRFIRHLMPYWNIHRHRVHADQHALLDAMRKNNQLRIISGYVQTIEKGTATIKLRHQPKNTSIKIKWLINCLGPSLSIKPSQQRLLSALCARKMIRFDPLELGLDVAELGALKNAAGTISDTIFAIGALTKGFQWECTAVPEIRKHCHQLATYLAGIAV